MCRDICQWGDHQSGAEEQRLFIPHSLQSLHSRIIRTEWCSTHYKMHNVVRERTKTH